MRGEAIRKPIPYFFHKSTIKEQVTRRFFRVKTKRDLTREVDASFMNILIRRYGIVQESLKSKRLRRRNRSMSNHIFPTDMITMTIKEVIGLL